MKKLNKIFLVAILIASFTLVAKAQQGFGTSTPAPSSVIDAVANNKGVLLPRIALTNTTVAAPVTAPANALTVFNTATTGDVTPGYYYWSQDIVTPANSKWVKLATSNDMQEPWKIQGTTNNAMLNTDHIYQMGRVAINKKSTDKQLEVAGSFKSLTKTVDGMFSKFEVGVDTTLNGINFPYNYLGISNTPSLLGSEEVNLMMFKDNAQLNAKYKNNSSFVNLSRDDNNTDNSNIWLWTEGSTGYKPTAKLMLDASSDSNGATIFLETSNDNYPDGGLGTSFQISPSSGISFNFSDTDPNKSGYYILPKNGGLPNQVLTSPGLVGTANQLAWKDVSTLIPEPFQVESTITKATTNTQNIYQNGNLGLGDFSTSNPVAKLDVRGAIRVGDEANTMYYPAIPHPGVVGINSATIGYNNIASGNNSIAFGKDNNVSSEVGFALGGVNEVSGNGMVAIGYRNSATNNGAIAIGNGSYATGHSSITLGTEVIASEQNAVALGRRTSASGATSTAMGNETTASGWSSTAMGEHTTASSLYETVMGYQNAITTGNAIQFIATDALLQVGINYSNALTILKNGNTGIAIPGTETAAKPTSTLQVAGSLSLALRVVANATTLTDKDHTIIYTGATSTTFTLPDASTCNGRIYRVVQYLADNTSSGPDITFSKNIYCADVSLSAGMVIVQTTSLWKAHQQFVAGGDTGGASSVTIQSDGTNWYAVGL